jgi:GntR family transcriptional regulator
VIFKLNPTAGQPLYLQLIQQVRYAIETGVLQDGDQLPGIRPLAEQIAVSHNTVAKAYSELEHEGLLDLRHGSGAYVLAARNTRSQADRIRVAQEKVRALVDSLKDKDFSDEEIRRLFEAALLHARPLERRSQ